MFHDVAQESGGIGSGWHGSNVMWIHQSPGRASQGGRSRLWDGGEVTVLSNVQRARKRTIDLLQTQTVDFSWMPVCPRLLTKPSNVSEVDEQISGPQTSLTHLLKTTSSFSIRSHVCCCRDTSAAARGHETNRWSVIMTSFNSVYSSSGQRKKKKKKCFTFLFSLFNEE